MIVVYQKITDTEIRRDARNAVRQINKWFKQNPNRTDCKTEVWYGKMVVVRRGHVSEDIRAAADAAIKGN